MGVKILAIIAEAATVPACLDAAEAAACKVPNASLEALHVIVDPSKLVVASEEIAFQRLREVHEGPATERAKATRAAYLAWKEAHPAIDVPLHWKDLIGGEEEKVTEEAGEFDVLALAMPHNLDANDALHAAFFKIHHPLFLVPSEWSLKPGSSFADHIVIAWNDTRPCHNAVEGALPWLRAARDVTVLLINEGETYERSVAHLLRREDISYRAHYCPRDDETLGDEILTKAHELGADLLVMGAYRHSEFVDWLLGGTTRHVLRHADLPLFMSH
ncbi:MAG: universal stress protein [Sphingomonas bacterium]